jgi:N-acetylmuramoyl-L-alanine amidase
LKFFFSLFILLSLGFVRCLGQFAPNDIVSIVDFPRIQYEVRTNTSKAVLVLDAVSIAGRVCAEPKAIACAFACGVRQKGTVVTFSFPLHTISSAADASFCAVRHHETDFVEMVQMFHPLALHEGRMYVPLEEFLHLLHETGVYSVEQDNALISLQTEQGEQPASTETTTFIAPNDDSPTNQTSAPAPASTTTAPQSATKFDKPTRNRYILPDDLKRRGLDTPPRMNYAPRGGGTASPRSVQALILRAFLKKTVRIRVGEEKYVFAPLIKGERGIYSANNTKVSVSEKSVGTESPVPPLSRGRMSAAPEGLQKKKSSPSEKSSTSTVKQASKNKTSEKITSEKVATDNDFSSAKRKWALDVIVLDAGHGGKDGGTIGFGKTKEKDVALGIVKKLGTFIKKEMPGTKVVYTRTDDTFVELERRGQIANENGGKLFVSIHCNSTPKKPSNANGFEVYILRPGRNEDAARIAEVENSVIKLEDDPKRYKPLTDEQFIIVSMAQSSFVKYSDMAAAMITAEVKKLKDIGVRGVNQAGFIVLVGASMPNMLIETGFLSNKKEEKFLKSAAGQTKLALAICRAIKAYRTRYEAQIHGVMVTSEQDAKKRSTLKTRQAKQILLVKTPSKKSSTIVSSKSLPSTKKK